MSTACLSLPFTFDDLLDTAEEFVLHPVRKLKSRFRQQIREEYGLRITNGEPLRLIRQQTANGALILIAFAEGLVVDERTEVLDLRKSMGRRWLRDFTQRVGKPKRKRDHRQPHRCGSPDRAFVRPSRQLVLA